MATGAAMATLTVCRVAHPACAVALRLCLCRQTVKLVRQNRTAEDPWRSATEGCTCGNCGKPGQPAVSVPSAGAAMPTRACAHAGARAGCVFTGGSGGSIEETPGVLDLGPLPSRARAFGFSLFLSTHRLPHAALT